MVFRKFLRYAFFGRQLVIEFIKCFVAASALAGFLSPQWQRALHSPAIALTSIESATTSKLDAPVAIQEHPVQYIRSFPKRDELKTKPRSSSFDEVSPSIQRDLAAETQQLLLEREVDTVDELHVR